MWCWRTLNVKWFWLVGCTCYRRCFVASHLGTSILLALDCWTVLLVHVQCKIKLCQTAIYAWQKHHRRLMNFSKELVPGTRIILESDVTATRMINQIVLLSKPKQNTTRWFDNTWEIINLNIYWGKSPKRHWNDKSKGSATFMLSVTVNHLFSINNIITNSGVCESFTFFCWWTMRANLWERFSRAIQKRFTNMKAHETEKLFRSPNRFCC